MPSLLHEGLLALVHNRPAFAGDLLTRLLHVELPPFTKARLAGATLNELVPVEYHADSVVLFGDDAPVYGSVIEVQLQRDDRKRFTWPLYAVGARARHECPVVVIVVTMDTAVAEWATGGIDLGGGNLWRPYVLGPDGIPSIKDDEQARSAPQLAVLSAVVHGRDEPKIAAEIAAAAIVAVEKFPHDQRLLYWALIEAAMSDDARKELQMLNRTPDFFSESQRRSFDRGFDKGQTVGAMKAKAELLVQVLRRRGLTVSEVQERLIVACGDPALLDRWWEAALVVTSTEQLLA